MAHDEDDEDWGEGLPVVHLHAPEEGFLVEGYEEPRPPSTRHLAKDDLRALAELFAGTSEGLRIEFGRLGLSADLLLVARHDEDTGEVEASVYGYDDWGDNLPRILLDDYAQKVRAEEEEDGPRYYGKRKDRDELEGEIYEAIPTYYLSEESHNGVDARGIIIAKTAQDLLNQAHQAVEEVDLLSLWERAKFLEDLLGWDQDAFDLAGSVGQIDAKGLVRLAQRLVAWLGAELGLSDDGVVLDRVLRRGNVTQVLLAHETSRHASLFPKGPFVTSTSPTQSMELVMVDVLDAVAWSRRKAIFSGMRFAPVKACLFRATRTLGDLMSQRFHDWPSYLPYPSFHDKIQHDVRRMLYDQGVVSRGVPSGPPSFRAWFADVAGVKAP